MKEKGFFEKLKLYTLAHITSSGLLNGWSDERYMRLIYRLSMGKRLELDQPKTYNEKLEWLKLHDRRPEYIMMVDKCEVKKFAAEKLGEEYVIPTIGLWNSVDDIDFDALPERFVLKCTHDSGGVFICRDKRTLDVEAAKAMLKKHFNANYFYMFREWPYKNVRPRIIAEDYLEDAETGELRDYKFFAFDGEVKALFVATERQKQGEEVKFDYFDSEFRHLPFRQIHENAEIRPEKPKNFELMKRLAAKLSEGLPQIRADFYECNGRVYFGEITLSHFAGNTPFDPEEWDQIFGSWITLPPRCDGD